jgi:hypothetical protein
VSGDETVSILHRRLQVALDKIDMRRVEHKDWDTAEGEAFIRLIMQAEQDGHDLDDLGRDLGVPNLRYVVRARERYLR